MLFYHNFVEIAVHLLIEETDSTTTSLPLRSLSVNISQTNIRLAGISRNGILGVILGPFVRNVVLLEIDEEI